MCTLKYIDTVKCNLVCDILSFSPKYFLTLFKINKKELAKYNKYNKKQNQETVHVCSGYVYNSWNSFFLIPVGGSEACPSRHHAYLATSSFIHLIMCKYIYIYIYKEIYVYACIIKRILYIYNKQVFEEVYSKMIPQEEYATWTF